MKSGRDYTGSCMDAAGAQMTGDMNGTVVAPERQTSRRGDQSLRPGERRDIRSHYYESPLRVVLSGGRTPSDDTEGGPRST